MLSRKALRYLHFLSKNTEYRSYMQMERDYRKFDPQQFWAIYHAGFLDCYPPAEFPDDPNSKLQHLIENAQFRINDAGYAYLDSALDKKLSETREWFAVTISLISLIVSFIAILLELATQQIPPG